MLPHRYFIKTTIDVLPHRYFIKITIDVLPHHYFIKLHSLFPSSNKQNRTNGLVVLVLVSGVMECVYTEQKAVVGLSLRRLYVRMRHALFQMTDSTHTHTHTHTQDEESNCPASLSVHCTSGNVHLHYSVHNSVKD